MTELDWKKYARYLPPSGKATCPICNKEIREGQDGVTYSKTRKGTHLFIHLGCSYKGSKKK